MIIDGHSYACGESLKPENIIKKLDVSDEEKDLIPGGNMHELLKL